MNTEQRTWLESSLMDYLKHELALARASSDYWRAKYILQKEASGEYVNAIRWYSALGNRFNRSPLDECDE